MINNNPRNTIIEDIKRYQQEQYKREDLPLLEALGLANAFLTAQYNVDEEIKQLWSSTQTQNT